MMKLKVPLSRLTFSFSILKFDGPVTNKLENWALNSLPRSILILKINQKENCHEISFSLIVHCNLCVTRKGFTWVMNIAVPELSCKYTSEHFWCSLKRAIIQFFLFDWTHCNDVKRRSPFAVLWMKFSLSSTHAKDLFQINGDNEAKQFCYLANKLRNTRNISYK